MKHWLHTQQENLNSYLIRPRRIALIYAFAVFIGLLVSWWYVGTKIEGRLANDEREQVAASVDTIGTSLTLAVNQRLMLITSVHSYMEAKIRRENDFGFGNLDEINEVNYFTSGLHNSTAGIRNIAIAPGGVMRYVYPYEENRSVLGYEPAQDERVNVREEVRRAVENGGIVLSLPYELIQGGQGLIARQAIFVNEDYWGLANVVLDVPPLLDEAGITSPPAGLDLALKDQSGQVFFGSEDVFHSNPVVYNVKLPEGSWELAGIPNVGWQASYQTPLLFYRVMGLTGLIAISLLTYQLINRRDRLESLVERRTHELALSNQTLITVLEGIDADVYVSDFETNEILFANKHIRDSFADDLVGKICYEVFREVSTVCAHCKNHLLLDAEDRPTGVHLWEDRNPITDRWYKNADRAIRWHDGRYVHLQIATDITEQRQAVDAIRESEERMRRMASAAHEGIGFTENGVIVEANKQLAQMLGCELSELIGRPAMDFVAPESHSLVIEKIKLRAEELYEHLAMKIDGTIFPVEVQARMLEVQGREMRVTAIRDISERKQAEEEVRAYQERFKVFFNSANDAIFVHPLMEEGFAPFIEVNNIACQRYGYSREEFLKLTAIDITKRTDVEEHSAPGHRKKLLKARHQIFETAHIKKSGEEFPVEINANIVEEHGRPVILAVVRDITKRKQAEEILRESEERYRNLFDSVPVGIYRSTPDGRFLDGNPALMEILGYPDQETMLAANIKDLYFENSIREQELYLIEQGDFVSNYRLQLRRYDGEVIWVQDSATAVRDSSGKTLHYYGRLEDITERVRAEEALRMKTRELESLFSISSHLRSAQSADEMLPLVLQEVRRVIQVDASAIILLEENEERFTCALGDGMFAENAGQGFGVEKSISGLVYKTRKPYVVDDLSVDFNKANVLNGTRHMGPAMCVPILSDDEFLGVLVSARKKGQATQPFSSSDVQLLTAIGEMVGNALRRARLYDQALARLQNVQALHSIDMAISANMDLSVVLEVLLAQGSAQLDVDAANVLLLNPHTHTLEYEAGYGFRTEAVESTLLQVGEGLPGWVALKREVLHVPDLSKSEGLARKKLLAEGFISYQAAPLIAKGQLRGVLEMFSRVPTTMDDEQRDFLETLATQAAIAIDNAQLFNNLQRSNFELEMAYDATIEGWSRALELRDQETEGHTLRVVKMTERLAQAMGVSGGDLLQIRRGALLHDIGKMGVPDRILLKPGKLDSEEWAIMKQHATYAFEMLWPIEFLRPAIDIPHYHHERWDGTGYPHGLKGEQIPLSARIFAVVDVWDALNSDRPYRNAWTEKKALEYITTNSGRQFDPRVVEMFLELRNKNGQV